MIGAHIVDGDIVILEDTKEVHNGDIVAALIDGETSLKRYVVDHGRPYLKAESPHYPDLVPARELRRDGITDPQTRAPETPLSRRSARQSASGAKLELLASCGVKHSITHDQNDFEGGQFTGNHFRCGPNGSGAIKRGR